MKRRSRKFGPRLTVSVTGDDYEALSALADKDDASISWVIRRAIGEYLRRHRAAPESSPQPPDPTASDYRTNHGKKGAGSEVER